MNIQWGTFNKGTALAGCHSIAQSALSGEGFRVANTTADGPQFLLGVGATVMLTIYLESVAPQNTRITVAAYSDNASAAEGARNRVRTRIVNATH